MKPWLVSSHVALSSIILRTRASLVQRRLSFVVVFHQVRQEIGG